ncbi:MAG: bifunctional proline dehydrogenase/L-glutamate gamma-semialdehyde dehydrogenase PutA [Rickettsiales bacterium]
MVASFKDLNKEYAKISENTFVNEKKHVQQLIDFIELSPAQFAKVKNEAASYVEYIRQAQHSGVESFMNEYSLSTEEGVAIMCLAESLLRIPDSDTAKALIADKLKNKDWKSHIGRSGSTFVNASTWGLLLTGKIVTLSESKFSLAKMINKLGEPVILQSIKQAIKMLSNIFIMGSDMASALKNAKNYIKQGYKLSFDILGESSRTQEQADHYYKQYIKAINDISKFKVSGDIYDQLNISIKLTALHPKVLLNKEEQVLAELLPRLVHLCKLAREAEITVSFDAEEATRLDIYLRVLHELIIHAEFKNYHGIGYVVQAYGRRAFYVIDAIIKLAQQTGKKIPVRLVKGAYWDSEIKASQELGLPSYPVFTKKEFTDVSYLACAQKMLAHEDAIYPQFATHNAYTIAAIREIAGRKRFEFQKLQGMGNQLHDKVLEGRSNSRIYAPVGKYEDLLAYLMRRLLENGANSSFVNIVSNKEVSVDEVVENPLSKSRRSLEKEEKLPEPAHIYGVVRRNSTGHDLGDRLELHELYEKTSTYFTTAYQAVSIIAGIEKIADKKNFKEVFEPTDHSKVVGKLYRCDANELLEALDVADKFNDEWAEIGVEERAKALENFGDLLGKHRYEFYALLLRESGKSIDDAISEVREAIDFAYYYANQARKLCAEVTILPGYTGESNELSMHPRGTFVCISPWNFPLAIFSGQVLAALVSGNTVVAKAAENTSLIACHAVKLMHQAGIPAKALNIVFASGRSISEVLLKDNRVKGVCFTGSTATAYAINRTLAARDTAIAPFIAETGGQNAMIVDSSALLEQAADAIVRSAFGSVGQRCSALRVVYIQEEIYKPLLDLIIGATNELKIGDTQDFSVDLGPVISAESRKELIAHIKVMKKHMVAIHKSAIDKHLEQGSFFVPHIIRVKGIADVKKENFGPILHVASYKSADLDKVIADINATGFGLTFGIQSRIQQQIHHVTSRVKAGNMYANRTIIGAVVGTQPFGGENNSGTGFKAGGPHYLLRFMTERIVTINTTAIGGNIELLS